MPPVLPPLPDLDPEVDLETTCALLGVGVDDVIAELEYRQKVKAQKMRRQMALAAKAGGTRRILRDRGDGGGYVEMMVAPVSYHYWGKRLGYQCWDDPQFCREYLRDNEAARVRSVSNRLTVLRPDLPAARSRDQGAGGKTNAASAVRGRRGRWAL